MPIFGRDTFTGTAGTLQTSHTPELGGPWTVSSGVSGVISNANRLRGPNAAGAGENITLLSTATPFSPDQIVTAGIHFKSGFANGEYGVFARHIVSAFTCYYAGYEVNAGQWALYRLAAGIFNVLGTHVQALSNNVTSQLELRCGSALKEVYIDGVQRISSTNNTHRLTGRTGIRLNNGGGNFSSDTAGIHFEDFQAQGDRVVSVGGLREQWNP